MRYFARVTAGTESLAWQEIGQIAGIQRLQTDYRRLDFEYDGSPADLLALRSVDDVYVFAGRLHPIDHTRASLQHITDGIRALDFYRAFNVCRTIGSFPKHPRYTVTASLLGKRNYSRYEVAEAVHMGLSDYRWQYVENAPAHERDHAPVDLDIRILVEQDWLIAGIRLGAYPLHRRPYKLNSLPGSLKAPVAYCMCLAAELQPDDILLDPMCGAGTIPIEAASFGLRTIAADLNPDAARSTLQNVLNAGTKARIMIADARQLPIQSESVDCIVSNPAWGKQVSNPDALPALYADMMREFARVLRPNGRCVLLTDRGDLLLTPMCLVSEQPISLYGSHPTIYRFDRG